MPLFHTTHAPLPIGTVLQPGRWGDVFRTQYFFDASSANGALAGWRLASELIIEDVRRGEFPDLPSRLACIFAHDEGQIARSWLPPGAINATHFIYEVELVDVSAPTHRAALNLMSAINRFSASEPFCSLTERLARAYWRGDDIHIPEIVIASPLRILRQLP